MTETTEEAGYSTPEIRLICIQCDKRAARIRIFRTLDLGRYFGVLIR